MKERLAAQMARVDRHEMVLQVHSWDDQWHRHYLSGIAEWIDDEIGKRKSRLVCFKRLAAWADSLEGGTAHQAQTRAIAVTQIMDHRIANRGFARLVEHRQLPDSCCRYELLENCKRALRCAFYAICFRFRNVRSWQ